MISIVTPAFNEAGNLPALYERLLAAIKPDAAEAVCANIMANTGVEQPTDDVAVLAIRRDP